MEVFGRFKQESTHSSKNFHFENERQIVSFSISKLSLSYKLFPAFSVSWPSSCAPSFRRPVLNTTDTDMPLLIIHLIMEDMEHTMDTTVDMDMDLLMLDITEREKLDLDHLNKRTDFFLYIKF
ncbi:hypothetical protein B9Z55_020334 [Caenorhabditis nigoni]|uniref:Uncharacterized protein n=1 Tax=Caenorhabditis nigoni TaxID=1611254 RepID=A0A2G5TMA2_9PELO|nr:hypothetical protein B9Z55_020334 [Caenorhabditis nigoni]